MSFSSKTKNEMCRLTLDKECCKISELSALIQTSGTIDLIGKQHLSFKINTENASVARRIFTLIKNLYDFNPEVLVRKNKRLRKNNNYILLIAQSSNTKQILKDTYILSEEVNGNINLRSNIDTKLIRKRCCKRAYLRGAFLGCGSVSNPEKGYHLEFLSHSKEYTKSLCSLLNEFDLHAKLIERKNTYVVYIKEGEHIVKLLSLMGAHTALLNLENIRIYKDMRNNINRIVNCETANLSKTVNASVRQVRNIEYIRDKIGFEHLSQSLRETAELRLAYPDASLKELGEMFSPSVGKSGVNHRFRKLESIVEEHMENQSVDNAT